MVKNKKGGSSHKKMARKFVNNPGPRKLRKAKLDDGELYAKVTQVYGNGMCNVICCDKTERLCIIRRRFKGRNKRDNMVVLNSILLVGLREWELIAKNKKPKVDLLYVYSEDDIKSLMKDENFNKLVWPENSTSEEAGKLDIEFTNEINNTQTELESSENKKIVHNKRVTKYKSNVLKDDKAEDNIFDEDLGISFDDI